MSDSGKQSPLGVNVLSSVLQNTGLNINPVAQSYMGVSKQYSAYTFGSVVQNTCLRLLTWAINDAYVRGQVNTTTYNNLISIGSTTIPALGNSKAPTFTWANAANNGSPTTALRASWNPYNNTNPVTQWGYIRLFALQAWNEFNYNGEQTASDVFYKDFCTSFITGSGFVEYTNSAIYTMDASKTFLQGTYSNMNDLISSDIAGVNLSLKEFGADLIATGKAINLSKISTFGLPSVLLQTIREFNALTQSLSLALLSSGLTTEEVQNIIDNAVPVTTDQEQKIYGAFLIIVGVDLEDILIPLNCKTPGLESLADLLNPKKLFPNSYQSLTVPLYNADPNLPTNSKTYYPIYNTGSVNSALTSPAVSTQVGPQTLPGTPPITDTRPAATSTQTFDSVVTDASSPVFTNTAVSNTITALDKANPPQPGWIWNEATLTWMSPDQYAFSNLDVATRLAIAREYSIATGQTFVETNNSVENQNIIDWYTKNVTQSPRQK